MDRRAIRSKGVESMDTGTWSRGAGVAAAVLACAAASFGAPGNEKTLWFGDGQPPAGARAAPAGPPTRMIRKDGSAAHFRSAADRCVAQDGFIHDGGRRLAFTRLTLPGGGLGGKEGHPELPCFGLFVRVPDGADATLVIDAVTWVPLEGRSVIVPRQPAPADRRGAPPPPFVLDREAYSRDAWLPAQPVELRDRMRIRRRAFVYVAFTPIAFNPARNRLQAAREVHWHLEFAYPVGTPKPDRRKSEDALGQALFRPMPALVLDATLPLPAAGGAGPSWMPTYGADYLIIAHDDFHSAILPLANWKRAKGYRTRVVKLSDISAAPTAGKITDFIRNAYATWTPAPAYLLLVGDSSFLPAHKRYDDIVLDDVYSDLPYAAVDGNDIFPDLAAGRIPCATAAECTAIVNKILAMEKTPVSAPAFYQNLLVAAYFQDENPRDGYEDRIFVETAEAVKDFMVAKGYTVATSYVDGGGQAPKYYNNRPDRGSFVHPNGAPYVGDPVYRSESDAAAAITAAVNAGVWMVLHRDHGSEMGWGHPPYTVSNVVGLANGAKTPVVFSINCLTGKYMQEGGDCFAEAWLKKPSGGAYGVIAATEVSLSWWNDWLAHGLFQCLYPEYLTTLSSFAGYRPDLSYANHPGYNPSWHLGQVLNYAKMMMYDKYAGGDPGGRCRLEFELFHVFGDPEQMPRRALPKPLTVDKPTSLSFGSPASFDISVSCDAGPVAGARVALVLDPTDYYIAATDTTGIAHFDFMPVGSGEMAVTVTHIDCLPYEGSIAIAESGRRLLIHWPNGGERYRVQAAVSVAWGAYGDSWSDDKTVRLDYSDDGGTTWKAIPGAGLLAYKQGTFEWDTSGCAPGDRYRVRVVENAGGGAQDASEADISLYPAGVIGGVVRLDGASLPDVRVECTGSDLFVASTGIDGRYRYVLEPGAYTVIAKKPGCLDPAAIAVTVPPDRTDVHFDYATAAVSGIVSDAEGGGGVVGAMLTYKGSFEGSTSSGLDGAYQIAHVYGRPGTLTVRVKKTGYFASDIRTVPVPPNVTGVHLALYQTWDLLSWGYNHCGQLGDDSTENSPWALGVLTLGRNVATCAAGYRHNIAATLDGAVWAWGYNYCGQLGDGSRQDRRMPVPVEGLDGAAAVAGGYGHSLAVKRNGTIWAWGANGAGQLGDGTNTERTTPVAVSGFGGAVGVSAGYYFSLALTSDGTVWAWGDNRDGQLGDGTTANRSLPIRIPNLSGAIRVACGTSHSLALTSDGTVWAWGSNSYGQLGDGSTANRHAPVPVADLGGVVAIDAGAGHSLALRSDGTVWAWGHNRYGQLGTSGTTDSKVPVQVLNLSGVQYLSAGGYHSLAVASDGAVWAWGCNGSGQLGDGTTVDRKSPVRAAGVNGRTLVSGGENHSLALRESRSFAIRLEAGYNLVALPVDPAVPLTAEDLARQINQQGGTCTSVIRYLGGAFETHPAGTAVANFPVAKESGYFVRCAAGSSWMASGYRFDARSHPIPLESGYNLIGLPVDPVPANRFTAEDVGIDINGQNGIATQVIAYDAASGQFVTHPVGTAVNNFPVLPGAGYFIRCRQPSIWRVSR
jgi:alpha-tubulin suppressor-like RCC1 family protein